MKRSLLIIATLVIFSLAGCVTQEDFDRITTESEQAISTIRSEAERHKQEAEAARVQLAAVEGEAREALEGQIEAHERLATTLTARADDLTKVLEGATRAYAASDAGGVVEEIGSTILPFLPPGAQGPAVLVLGIGGLVARLVQRSKALKGIVGSIERAKKADPEFAAAFAKVAPVIDATQGTAAKKAVDAVQAKRLPPV